MMSAATFRDGAWSRGRQPGSFATAFASVASGYPSPYLSPSSLDECPVNFRPLHLRNGIAQHRQREPLVVDRPAGARSLMPGKLINHCLRYARLVELRCDAVSE